MTLLWAAAAIVGFVALVQILSLLQRDRPVGRAVFLPATVAILTLTLVGASGYFVERAERRALDEVVAELTASDDAPAPAWLGEGPRVDLVKRVAELLRPLTTSEALDEATRAILLEAVVRLDRFVLLAEAEFVHPSATVRFGQRLQRLRDHLERDRMPDWAAALALLGATLGSPLGLAVVGALVLIYALQSGAFDNLRSLVVSTQGIQADLAAVDEADDVRSGRAQKSAGAIKAELDEQIETYRLAARKLLDDATRGDLETALTEFVDLVVQSSRFARLILEETPPATAADEAAWLAERFDALRTDASLSLEEPTTHDLDVDKLRITVHLPDLVLSDHLIQSRPYAPHGGRHQAGRTFGVGRGIVGRAWRRRRAEAVPDLDSAEDGLMLDYYGHIPTAEEKAGARQSLAAFPLPARSDADPDGVLFMDHRDPGAWFGSPPTPEEAERAERAFLYAVAQFASLRLLPHVRAANAALEPFRLKLRTSAERAP